VYQWLAGGFFLAHHVDVMIGQRQVRALELIGEYDPATDSFTARAYDNLGDVTTMQARLDEQGVWRFTGGGDVASVARPADAGAGPRASGDRRMRGDGGLGRSGPSRRQGRVCPAGRAVPA
jgi:hypothetical protein